MKRTKSELLSNTKDVKNSKFIDNNTLSIEYQNGTKAIRLHNTDVVTFEGSNFILNSGGWRTSTTKDRINKYTPARISQNKGLWYLRDGNLFFDGCKINAEGHLIGKPVKIDDKKVETLKKQITKYCNLITKDNLPLPDSGDCWFCALTDKNNVPMGDLGSKDYSHLTEHLREGYLHGSILVNAMRGAGYQDQQIGFHYQLKLVDTFKRTLRRYLQKRLISNIAVK